MYIYIYIKYLFRGKCKTLFVIYSFKLPFCKYLQALKSDFHFPKKIGVVCFNRRPLKI